MEILTSVKRLYIRFKSLVNDFVYSFGRAALLLLVEVQNHTVPVRERRRIRVKVEHCSDRKTETKRKRLSKLVLWQFSKWCTCSVRILEIKKCQVFFTQIFIYSKRVMSLSKSCRHIEGAEVQLHSFVTSAPRSGQCPLYPGKELPYPQNRKLFQKQKGSRRLWRRNNFFHLLEFELRTFQRVASSTSNINRSITGVRISSLVQYTRGSPYCSALLVQIRIV